jgi:hypothetical protein
MLDERLMAPIRRWWTRAEVETAYQRIFAAYSDRLTKKVVIVSKSNEGESAQSQLVVEKADYLDWMESLEARLSEFDADAAGEGPLLEGTEHVDFSRRYART